MIVICGAWNIKVSKWGKICSQRWQKDNEECQNVMKGGRDEARLFDYKGERERMRWAVGSHIDTALVLTLQIQVEPRFNGTAFNGNPHLTEKTFVRNIVVYLAANRHLPASLSCRSCHIDAAALTKTSSRQSGAFFNAPTASPCLKAGF